MTRAAFRRRALPGDHYAAAVIEHAERFGLDPRDSNCQPWERLDYERPDPIGRLRWSEESHRKIRRQTAEAALAGPSRLVALTRKYERMS